MESQNHNKQNALWRETDRSPKYVHGRQGSQTRKPDYPAQLQKGWEIRVLLRNIAGRRAVSQRFEQVREPVVVYFMHQGEQPANFS